MKIRVGSGYDVHAFAEGRPLLLGGVNIPHICGLEGHSDADVLLHAVTDALLGALALGDIGMHFPDTDPKWKGANSADLLTEVVHMVNDRGWSVVNVDATVVAEEPKLRPHISNIRERMAALLHLDPDDVSVKATTSEQMGFVGRKEGIVAHATALLESDS
ncbi:MAG: 2-C-methyl-D-erythritol 2,4-cyclodiphosphate synthase [Balneolaceae bacterium]